MIVEAGTSAGICIGAGAVTETDMSADAYICTSVMTFPSFF